MLVAWKSRSLEVTVDLGVTLNEASSQLTVNGSLSLGEPNVPPFGDYNVQLEIVDTLVDPSSVEAIVASDSTLSYGSHEDQLVCENGDVKHVGRLTMDDSLVVFVVNHASIEGIYDCTSNSIGKRKCILNPCLWTLYPFDPSDHLKYGDEDIFWNDLNVHGIYGLPISDFKPSCCSKKCLYFSLDEKLLFLVSCHTYMDRLVDSFLGGLDLAQSKSLSSRLSDSVGRGDGDDGDSETGDNFVSVGRGDGDDGDDETGDDLVSVVRLLFLLNNPDGMRGDASPEWCKSCGQRNCSGHCGHIEFVSPVYNPLLFNMMHNLLQKTCFYCFHFRASRAEVEKWVSELELIAKGDVVGAKTMDALSPDESSDREESEDSHMSCTMDDLNRQFQCEYNKRPSWNNFQFIEAMAVIDRILKTKSGKCSNCDAKNPKITKPSFGRFHMTCPSASAPGHQSPTFIIAFVN
ncbi:hypothetical protein CQW23_24605 [Capsicum baccatum]|uniref:DNA-directed RNA polymerase n=1 Tax=Capsicum baccatum TaxID=33114 RepID=A0A2G2VVA1_CAPBA|nr:hypothetical protein CQW23_24605 [Capsicum baccatum]